MIMMTPIITSFMDFLTIITPGIGRPIRDGDAIMPSPGGGTTTGMMMKSIIMKRKVRPVLLIVKRRSGGVPAGSRLSLSI